MAIQLLLIVAALWVAAWWRIFTRLGYPGVLSLLMLVPVLNFVVLLMIAFAPDWPVEKGFRWRRGESEPPPPRRPWLRSDPPPGDDWI